MAPRMLQYVYLIDGCLQFFLRLAEGQDIGQDLEIQRPDSQGCTRRARALWEPHVVAAAVLAMEHWGNHPTIGMPNPAEPPLTTRATSRRRSRSRRAVSPSRVPGGDAARARGSSPDAAAAADRSARSKRPGSRPPRGEPQSSRQRPPPGGTGSQPSAPTPPTAYQRTGPSTETHQDRGR